MRARSKVIGLLLTATITAAGCGPVLKVERVPMTTNSINGLAVRMNTPHRVLSVFRERPGGGGVVEYEETVMLPSTREMYVVNYNGALFFSNELQVELYPSTTLKRVKITSDPQVDDALKALADAATNAGSAVQTLNPPDQTTTPGASLTAKFCKQALRANLRAIAAGEELPYPDVTSCP